MLNPIWTYAAQAEADTAKTKQILDIIEMKPLKKDRQQNKFR